MPYGQDTKFGRKNPWPKCNECWDQRLCRGQPGDKLLRNALWLPNLVRTSDQKVIHCWGQRSCGVSCGQSEVKLLGNVPNQPNVATIRPLTCKSRCMRWCLHIYMAYRFSSVYKIKCFLILIPLFPMLLLLLLLLVSMFLLLPLYQQFLFL